MSNRICPQCRASTDDAVCPVDGFPTVDAKKYGAKAKADPLIGTTFEDRYRIERKLGQGGMGAVYKATQLAVDRAVALKVMNKDLGDDLKEVARFQQEARAIASLHHPNVISLIDFGQASTGQLFLVMEFIEGEPLNHLLRREAPISPKRVHQMATQITEALAEAHELGIVHRDMKPENLFVTQLGRRGDFIKVLDFGIAKVRNDQAADIDLTRTGAIIGSPRYMAPEQARGQTITGQTDLYAVGCILYEMLSGKPVFKAASATDYVIAHVTQPPPPLMVEGRELKGPLVDLVMQMLRKKPWDRPQGCEAVLRALEECREHPILTAQSGPEPATGLLEVDPGLPSLPGIAPLSVPAAAPPPETLTGSGAPVDMDTSVSRQTGSIPGEMLSGGTAQSTTTPAGRRWGPVVAVLVLLAGAGVAAVVLSGGDEGVKPTVVSKSNAVRAGAASERKRAPSEAAPSLEKGPEVSVQVRDAAASAGGTPEPTPDAASPSVVAVDAGPEAVAAVDVTAANVDSAPAPAVAVPVLKPVTVVTKPPGARVFLEEVAVGVTPYEANWTVTEDPPELRIEAPRGFVDAEVELRASQRGQSLTVAFEKKKRKKKRSGAKKAPAPKKKKGKWL